ncbi:epoxide hydrolase 4-like [Neocloeon triangulifer]|uniref:epoxide hydrolase 4-like n=1 Tax=Neocloeon triangulifer TaxID=2078957 RepID=UPI00286F7DF5|nr:epoxide hydrolase 4-like [Neocloeon triangulifer]
MWKSIATWLVVYAIAFFYTWLLALSYLWKYVTNPGVKFWRVQRRDTPPDCLTNPDYGQHSYIQLKDVKLHYVEKGDKSKELMLFVHGFPEFWYSWRNQIKEFSKDYWVVAIDLRGYGDSEKPRGTAAYSLNTLVDDLRQLVLALGKKDCILVSHDWGAVISWYFVMTNPQLVSKYIVMNLPFPEVIKSHPSIKQFFMSWYMFFFQLPFLPELFVSSYDFAGFPAMLRAGKGINSKVTAEDVEAFKYTFGKPGALTPPINFYRRNIFSESGAKGLTRKPKTMPPGLLIFGEGDKYLDIRGVELSKNYVPKLQTKIIKRGNHFVQQDEPEAVNEAMREFLKSF